MNKTVWIVSVILLFSCTSNPVSKPKNLLDEDTMVAIMYDVAVLQVASANAPDQLHQKGIDAKILFIKNIKLIALPIIKTAVIMQAMLNTTKKCIKKYWNV